MDIGVLLGSTSIGIHVVDKVISLMHHFKFHSACCGQDVLDIKVDTGTPLNDKLVGVAKG